MCDLNLTSKLPPQESRTGRDSFFLPHNRLKLTNKKQIFESIFYDIFYTKIQYRTLTEKLPYYKSRLSQKVEESADF